MRFVPGSASAACLYCGCCVLGEVGNLESQIQFLKAKAGPWRLSKSVCLSVFFIASRLWFSYSGLSNSFTPRATSVFWLPFKGPYILHFLDYKAHLVSCTQNVYNNFVKKHIKTHITGVSTAELSCNALSLSWCDRMPSPELELVYLGCVATATWLIEKFVNILRVLAL